MSVEALSWRLPMQAVLSLASGRLHALTRSAAGLAYANYPAYGQLQGQLSGQLPGQMPALGQMASAQHLPLAQDLAGLTLQVSSTL